MEKIGTIRLLCVGMIAAVLVLSLLMVVAVCGGIPVLGEGEDDTVRKGFWDMLGEDPTGPLPIETVDWENMTMPPETTEGEGTEPDEPGMDDRAELDADMRDVPVLEVEPEVDGMIYLKMQSYADYTGQGWTEAKSYSQLLDGASADFLPGSAYAALTGVAPYTMEITPLYAFSVLPYYAYGVDGELPISDVRVEGNTSGAFRVLYYDPDVALDNSPLRSYERALRNHAYSSYLNVDAETKNYMQRIIDEQGFSADDPDIIEKVAKYIQKAAAYNLDFDESMESESNVVIAFLDEYKEGVCRHYAAAATLLFRSLYIPARYTVGFAAEGKAGETTLVKGANAHAWVEVYVNGFGWQRVEVTGSIEEEKPIVELRLPDVHVPYDGTYQVYSGKVMGFEEYEALGYRCEVEVSPANLIRGQAEVSIKSVRIFDPDGQPATDDFQIVLPKDSFAVYTVYYQAVTVASYTITGVYDGHPLTVSPEDIYILAGSLPAGHSIVTVPDKMASRTVAGTSTARFDVCIIYTDDNGDTTDVTEFFTTAYDIGLVDNQGKAQTYTALSKKYGSLVVTPRPITLTAGSETAKKADLNGEALTAQWIEEIRNGSIGDILAAGDYIVQEELEFTGSKSVRGTADNTIVLESIVIRNAAGDDVTSNYVITTVKGLLRVK